MGRAQFPNAPMGSFGNCAVPILQWALDFAKSKAHWSMGTAQFPNEPMGAFGNWALPMLQWAFVDVVVFGC